MSTPKEKAKELVNQYYNEINIDAPDCSISFNQCKKCALIAVDEIINALRKDLPEIGFGKGYWHDVKTEIEKL